LYLLNKFWRCFICWFSDEVRFLKIPNNNNFWRCFICWFSDEVRFLKIQKIDFKILV
jgi:hypothetical protein